MKVKVRKNDNVKVLSGKDRGKTGKVLRVFPREGKVIVENINLVKKHYKSHKAGQPSEIMTVASPLSICKVQLICPKCSKPVRVGSKKIKKGQVVRVCKKCQAEF